MPEEPLCEVCSTRRASLKMTALRVGGFKGRTYVCARCAMDDPGFKTAGGFDLAAFVFLTAEKQVGSSSKTGCSECGTSLVDVATGGRMGCAACYDRFATDVEHTLNAIHGATVHRGKEPGR